MDRNLCVVIYCRRHCLKRLIFVAHLDEVRWILCFTLDVCVQSKFLLLEQVSYLSYDWSYLHQTCISWFWCMLWYSIWTRQDEPSVRMLEEVKAFGAARSNGSPLMTLLKLHVFYQSYLFTKIARVKPLHILTLMTSASL